MNRKFIKRISSAVLTVAMSLTIFGGITPASAAAGETVYLQTDLSSGNYLPFRDLYTVRGHASTNSTYNQSISKNNVDGVDVMRVYSYPRTNLPDGNGGIFSHDTGWAKFGSIAVANLDKVVQNDKVVLSFDYKPGGAKPNLNVCLVPETTGFEPSDAASIEATGGKSYLMNLSTKASLSKKIVPDAVTVDLNKQKNLETNKFNQILVNLDMVNYTAEMYVNGVIMGVSDIDRAALPKIAGIQFIEEASGWNTGWGDFANIKISTPPKGLTGTATYAEDNKVNITFSYPIADGFDLTASDFTVKSVKDETEVAVSDVEFDDGKVVLTLGGTISENTGYKILTGDNVKSIFGSTMTEPPVLYKEGSQKSWRTVWSSDFSEGASTTKSKDNDGATAGWDSFLPVGWTDSFATSSNSGHTYYKNGDNWELSIKEGAWNRTALIKELGNLTTGKYRLSYKVRFDDNTGTDLILSLNTTQKNANWPSPSKRLVTVNRSGTDVTIYGAVDVGNPQIGDTTSVTNDQLKQGITITAEFDLDNDKASYLVNGQYIKNGDTLAKDRAFTEAITGFRFFGNNGTGDGKQYYLDDVKWEAELPPSSVKSVKFVCADGTTLLPAANNAAPAGATGIIVDFAGGPTVQTSHVTFSGKTLTGSYDSVKGVYTGTFDTPLEINTDYTLTVSADAISTGQYVQNFTTDGGEYKVAELDMTEGNLNYTLVNTTGDSKSAYVAYAMYSGSAETGYTMETLNSVVNEAAFTGMISGNQSVSVPDGQKAKVFAWTSDASMENLTSAYATGSTGILLNKSNPANDATQIYQTGDVMHVKGFNINESVSVRLRRGGLTVYVDQLDGSGDFDFAINPVDADTYTVEVIKDNTVIDTYTFDYVSSATMATEYTDLFDTTVTNNLADATTFKTYAAANKLGLGFVSELDTAETNDQIMSLLYNQITTDKPDNATELKVAYEKCVLMANLNAGNITNIYDYIGDFVVSADDMIASSALKAVFNETYVTEEVQKVITSKLKALAPTTVEQFDKKIVEAFALGCTQKASGWGSVQKALNAVGSEIGLTVTVERSGAEAVVGNNYSNKTQLNEALLAAQRNNGGGNDNDNSFGGGTTGNTGNKKVQSTIDVPAPIEKTDKFVDLAGFDWAKDDILALADKGIIAGKGNAQFAPNDSITREEFTKIIVGAFIGGSETKNPFNDVKESDWFYPFVKRAYAAGIISGVSEDVFGVGSNITRQDMAVIMHRTAEYIGFDLGEASNDIFADDANIADYAKDAVYALKGAGLVNGVSDTEFAPNNNLTRAEAAVIINRLLSAAE